MRWFVGAMILALTIPVLACGGGDNNVSSPLAVGTPETQAPSPGPWQVYPSGPAPIFPTGLLAAAIMVTTGDLAGTAERLVRQDTIETPRTAVLHAFFAAFACSELLEYPHQAALDTLNDKCQTWETLFPLIQGGQYEEVSKAAQEMNSAAEDYFWQSCPVDRNTEGGPALGVAMMAVRSENLQSALNLSTEAFRFSDSELALYAALVQGDCGYARVSSEGEPLFPALFERIDAPCSAADSQGLYRLVATGQREQASALAWDIFQAAAGYLVSVCSSAFAATK